MPWYEPECRDINTGVVIYTADIAIKLSTRQSEISRFERRQDAHISSLAAYVAALGGQLDLVARFPGQHIRIRLGHP